MEKEESVQTLRNALNIFYRVKCVKESKGGRGVWPLWCAVGLWSAGVGGFGWAGGASLSLVPLWASPSRGGGCFHCWFLLRLGTWFSLGSWVLRALGWLVGTLEAWVCAGPHDAVFTRTRNST